MYFLTEDDDLLNKYNTIWDQFSADIKKNLIVSLSTMQKNLKTKTKSHGDVTGFYNKEIHNVDSNHNKLGFHSQKR